MQQAFDELHDAMVAFGMAFVESLYIPRIVEWLSSVLARCNR